MRHLIAATLLTLTSALGLGSVAVAQEQPVVVELYTSQGCSSCPPADKLLGKLAQRGDVIALALHVDYWDYIGWKDIFASPAYTKRQKTWAKHHNKRTVYTPQMIVGGQEDVVGNRPMDVANLIAKHARQNPRADVSVKRSGRRLTIDVAPRTGSTGGAIVQVVEYRPHAQVQVKRGENAGKTLTYHNIVHRWDVAGKWNGRNAKRLTAELSGDGPAVVIVQADRSGPILGAARVK